MEIHTAQALEAFGYILDLLVADVANVCHQVCNLGVLIRNMYYISELRRRIHLHRLCCR